MIAGGKHAIRPGDMCNHIWGEVAMAGCLSRGGLTTYEDRHVLTSRSLYMNCSLTRKVMYISLHVKPRIRRLRQVHHR